MLVFYFVLFLLFLPRVNPSVHLLAEHHDASLRGKDGGGGGGINRHVAINEHIIRRRHQHSQLKPHSVAFFSDILSLAVLVFHLQMHIK